MSISYSYKIINNKEKKVEITYSKKRLLFQLRVKRAFTVLIELLKAYPGYINIHSLDKTLNDPNRAHSSLRNENGFAEYLIEKRGDQRVNYIKIDIDKLFNNYYGKRIIGCITLSVLDLRKVLSDEVKDRIFKKHKGKCNITNISLYQNLPQAHFFKSGLLATYDHRIPISKGGKDIESNLQLLSVLANNEKNKICNKCVSGKCNKCALAFPERFDLILMNGQNISVFKS